MTMTFHEDCQEVCAQGTRFEIQEIDVLGLPTKVFAATPLNMRSLFAAAAARTDEFIVFEDERWIAAFAAITWVGVIAVPMNAWWQTDEMVFALADSGARIVFADADRLAREMFWRASPTNASVRSWHAT